MGFACGHREGTPCGRVVMLLLLFLCLAAPGCMYLHDRGRDALDIFDVGITVSNHLRPDLGAFVSFWNILPIGFAHVEGKLVGIGNGRVGVLDFVHDRTWGAVIWGAEQHGVADGVRVTPEGPPRYDQGALRLALGAERSPPGHQYFDCDRTFHLGWLGIHLRIKLDELADFFLGWTTLDIMKDDGLPRGLPAEANPRWKGPQETGRRDRGEASVAYSGAQIYRKGG